MVRTRLTSSALSTGGSFCGSLMCHTSAAKSCRRSVTRNRNRTPVMIRLRLQMLAPLSTRCSWKRRTSSGVAVSGERLSQAANRLQLEMWLRCVCGLSLRAAISSSIRWRSGLTVLVSLMGSSILSEVDEHLDSQDGALHPLLASFRLVKGLSALAPAQRAGAQRLCALAHNADSPAAPKLTRSVVK